MLSNFKTEDITFKNARKQSKVAEELGYFDEENNDSPYFKNSVPQLPIIERAIKYYEENAEGQYKVLYSATATWLKSLLSVPKSKQHTESNEEVEEVDVSEIKEED